MTLILNYLWSPPNTNNYKIIKRKINPNIVLYLYMPRQNWCSANCLISLYFDILLRKKSVYLLKTIIYLTFEKVNYQNIYILKKWNDWIKTVTRLDLNSWVRPLSNCIWVPIRSRVIILYFESTLNAYSLLSQKWWVSSWI